MNSFIESALSRKPLSLVRRQAHLGDAESRYTPVSIISSAGEGSEERPQTIPAAAREAPLRHLSLFDLVAVCAILYEGGIINSVMKYWF